MRRSAVRICITIGLVIVSCVLLAKYVFRLSSHSAALMTASDVIRQNVQSGLLRSLAQIDRPFSVIAVLDSGPAYCEYTKSWFVLCPRAPNGDLTDSPDSQGRERFFGCSSKAAPNGSRVFLVSGNPLDSNFRAVVRKDVDVSWQFHVLDRKQLSVDEQLDGDVMPKDVLKCHTVK